MDPNNSLVDAKVSFFIIPIIIECGSVLNLEYLLLLNAVCVKPVTNAFLNCL